MISGYGKSCEDAVQVSDIWESPGPTEEQVKSCGEERGGIDGHGRASKALGRARTPGVMGTPSPQGCPPVTWAWAPMSCWILEEGGPESNTAWKGSVQQQQQQHLQSITVKL